MAQLEALGEPKGGVFASVDGTLVQRRWLRTFGMVIVEPDVAAALGRAVAMNPELTLRDLLTIFSRLRWNMQLLWPEFCAANLVREVPAVDVPVCFVVGAHDPITSPELAQAYLDVLRAPQRAYALFHHSGHLACFEEPRRFLEVMLGVRAEHGSDRAASAT